MKVVLAAEPHTVSAEKLVKGKKYLFPFGDDSPSLIPKYMKVVFYRMIS